MKCGLKVVIFHFYQIYHFKSTEESKARKELRAMVQSYLTEEIKKMKLSVEEQLKATEDSLSKKIDTAEGGGNKSGKGGRGSAKGKKK